MALAMIKALSTDELAVTLTDPALQAWKVREGMLHREYRFDTFVDAFSFMTAVALRAEALSHHPEWSNTYGRVTVDLFTHDSGGITERDVALALQMERLAAGRTLS